MDEDDDWDEYGDVGYNIFNVNSEQLLRTILKGDVFATSIDEDVSFGVCSDTVPGKVLEYFVLNEHYKRGYLNK